MKAKLIDLGRHKFNGEVSFNTMKQLKKEVQKHLLSKGWAFEFTEGDKKAAVVVGGFRVVGYVELLDGCFRVQEVAEPYIEETT